MSIPDPDIQNSSPRRKLRLCYISNPNLIHTRRWVSWFASRGHTVCLLADVPLKKPWSEIPVIDLSKIFYARYVRFPIWTAWIRSFVHKWQPDVVHAHRITSAGWMAAASGFHPLVITPWGVDIFVQPQHSWLARILAQYTLRKADMVTILSDDMGQMAIQLGAKRNKLNKIQFGVETDIFKPASKELYEILELRRRLSLPEDARIVLSPRAVTPIYNLDIIIKSIPIIREHFPDAFFVFINYNTDLEYKMKLDQMVLNLELTPYVRWVQSTDNRRELANLYQLCDIAVSVSSTDAGTPISIHEAMACAKPVVCSDLPQAREFITDKENGLLVPVRQVSSLAEAIIQLLTNPEMAAQFGHRALSIVAEKANADIEMQHMESLYYKLVENRSK